MAEKEPAEELWIFGGTRSDKDGKRYHEWIDADGNALRYKAVGQYAVGWIYRVQVLRNGERTTRYGTPEYTGDKAPDRELVERLAALNRAAELIISLKAKERAARKDDPIEQAIERLVALTIDLAPSQRTAMAVYVTQRLAKGWYRKD